MGGRVKGIYYLYAITIFITVISLITFVWGCSYALFPGDGEDPPTADASPPSGSSINGSTPIVIKFSESMDTITLSLGGDMASDSIEVAWTKTNYEDDTLTISPIDTWTEGSDRRLTIDCNDLSGTPLSQLILNYSMF